MGPVGCGDVTTHVRHEERFSQIMATDLLKRRGRSPVKLYTQKSYRPTTSASSHRPTTPSSLQFYSSVQPLEIVGAQFHCQQNAKQNHSEGLQATECEVILRRGNTLILKIVTSLEISNSYIVSLTFVPVFRPRDRFGQFRANGIGKGSCNLWLSIAIPCNFPIGKYHAHITLSVKGRVEVTTYFHNKAIAILFNPWNQDDDTFLKNEFQRQAYLLDDVGPIWRGTESHKVPLFWEYGQYGEYCLDVALFLLRSLTADECRSAASVSRCLISRINTRDNSGILTGSSGGSHVGGTHPCRWTGSTTILGRFYRTKTPVRYGQCWVFAGVAVSLLRAVGIASRPVTCYNAAHCVQKLGQVDRYFSAAGDLVANMGRDQIWAYHVWCEAWMRRDDLPRGYDGWQVLDATSQDRQSGHFRIGPASVLAIRKGQSGKKWPHNVEFLRSQLTADVCYFRVTSNFSTASNQAISLAKVCKGEVGTAVVTSAYAKSAMCKPLELTADYHDIPASNSDPLPVGGPQLKGFLHPPTRDCSFELKLCDQVKLGEDITISVTVSNNGAMLRTVDGRLVGTAVYYTGHMVRTFISLDFSGLVSPGQSATVKLPIESKKYMRNIVEQSIIEFFVVVKVRETKQLFLKVHPFQLALPELQIQCPSAITEGSTFKLKISFCNILHRSLTRVLFLVQAQALCPQRELSHKRLVLPGGTASVELTLRAHCVGNFHVLVSMFCDQLTDIRGHAEITVISSSTT